MQYIQNVCEDCGFVTEFDKLRIPSTKRVCIISSGRNPQRGGAVAEFLREKCSSVEFRARGEVEKVQNCTQLDRSLVKGIVGLVYRHLIEEACYESEEEKKWNPGGSVAIKDLVERLPQTMLKELKKECGGLQTLLRNHRYIFELGGGIVKLRRPATSEATRGRYKDKPCWFFVNHVDGCVNSMEDCAYKH